VEGNNVLSAAKRRKKKLYESSPTSAITIKYYEEDLTFKLGQINYAPVEGNEIA
jgi:hypothetical protein